MNCVILSDKFGFASVVVSCRIVEGKNSYSNHTGHTLEHASALCDADKHYWQ